MSAYDANLRRDSPYGSNLRPSWNPSINDSDGVAGLNDRFSGLEVSGSSEGSAIIQVMKAVEDAESTIKQQVEVNRRLMNQIQRQTQEIEKFKLESSPGGHSADVLRGAAVGHYEASMSNIPVVNEAGVRCMNFNSSMNHQAEQESIHQNGTTKNENPALQTYTGKQQYSVSTSVNGFLKVSPGVQTAVDNAGVSQLSTPSSTSLSSARHRKEGEYDPRIISSGQGLIPHLETGSNNLWKQDLATKVKEREEEIAMLKKHLADYSVKDAQIRNETYVLEKRIAYMRMSFDQQQQDLVDAASKVLSYRQDITEENIRLTYALQAVQQERSTYVSSLLPLLTECNLQPVVLDALSIVSNLKVVFKHLQEKLILTEENLKESGYQFAPLRAGLSNDTSFPPQLPSHLRGATVMDPNKRLEIVPQPAYSHVQSPISSPSNALTKQEQEAVGNQNHLTGRSGFATEYSDQDGLQRSFPSVTRNTVAFDTSSQVIQADTHVARFTAETKDQNLSFKDLVRGNEMDDPEPTGLRHRSDGTVYWEPEGSPYLSSGLDDPNSSYPYLPPVLEEPGSSFSEAAEDDPLPAIERLQISGEAFPGRELHASGYSINGTTCCNFEWVRYHEDGSVNYIEGATQPSYLVTADDVNSYLAIEVHPLDDRKRKGELVKVIANGQRKITCDPEMLEQLGNTLSIGQISYEVLLSAKNMDIWEQAVLAIKWEGYSIKCSGPRGVVVTQKFLPATSIIIPYGHPTEFIIQCANGNEYFLRAKGNSWLRDTIVLTMRYFKEMALEKRKARKKGLFFKS